jgi:predicted lipid-binding transport protein (Tim44 family)
LDYLECEDRPGVANQIHEPVILANCVETILINDAATITQFVAHSTMRKLRKWLVDVDTRGDARQVDSIPHDSDEIIMK